MLRQLTYSRMERILIMAESVNPGRVTMGILASASICHMLNDMLQSLLPAIYPMLAQEFSLDFTRIGLLTLTYQITASILQPVVGAFTDKHPQPFSLPFGMGCTLTGLILLSMVDSYPMLLLGASFMGVGSSIFHPETSRVARMASGGRHGLAQSLFQVGGNFGTSLGPLLAAFIVLPGGRDSIRWASLAAVLGIALLLRIGFWYRAHHRAPGQRGSTAKQASVPPAKARLALGILLLLIFSKYFYLASFSSYYIFYLMQSFGVDVGQAQVYLFVFLGAVAAGTIIGGPLGDRFGRKRVIVASILGVVPFTLVLPYVGLTATVILSVPIGLILASAFPAIVVYGQELMPGKVGTIAGLMFGFAFGLGGIGAAVLGWLADQTSIGFVYHVCAFLPLLGIFALLLPKVERRTA